MSSTTATVAATAAVSKATTVVEQSATNNNSTMPTNNPQQGGMQQGGMWGPPGPECFTNGMPNGMCGPLPPPPPPYMPIQQSTAQNNNQGNDKGYVKFVLPVIGILFIIALFGVYLYLLTNKKKKSKYNNNMSYSLPKISVDDKDAAQSGQEYINKLGQYKSPLNNDFDSAYRSPVAGSLSSFTMNPQGFNGLNGVGMGNISMGNLSSAAYLGTQPIMVDPLYETSLNYSMKGVQRKPVGNKSFNNVSRYAGSDVGINPSVTDPLSNIMLSPIEPTSFNVNTSKPY